MDGAVIKYLGLSYSAAKVFCRAKTTPNLGVATAVTQARCWYAFTRVWAHVYYSSLLWPQSGTLVQIGYSMEG